MFYVDLASRVDCGHHGFIVVSMCLFDSVHDNGDDGDTVIRERSCCAHTIEREFLRTVFSDQNNEKVTRF